MVNMAGCVNEDKPQPDFFEYTDVALSLPFILTVVITAKVSEKVHRLMK